MALTGLLATSLRIFFIARGISNCWIFLKYAGVYKDATVGFCQITRQSYSTACAICSGKNTATTMKATTLIHALKEDLKGGSELGAEKIVPPFPHIPVVFFTKLFIILFLNSF